METYKLLPDDSVELINSSSDTVKICRTDKICRTEFTDESVLSTVFLGLDHSWDVSAHPVLFETMLFPDLKEEYFKRYRSIELAMKNHKRLVNKLVKCGRVIKNDYKITLVKPKKIIVKRQKVFTLNLRRV